MTSGSDGVSVTAARGPETLEVDCSGLVSLEGAGSLVALKPGDGGFPSEVQQRLDEAILEEWRQYRSALKSRLRGGD